jgi:hypothetical protein
MFNQKLVTLIHGECGHCTSLLTKIAEQLLLPRAKRWGQSRGAFGPFSRRAMNVTTTRKAAANATAATVAQSMPRGTSLAVTKH